MRRRDRGSDAVALCVIVAIGLVVFLPALRAPLFLDDYLQGAMVEGTFPARRGPFDLYDFVSDADRAALSARGLLPWWTDPRLTIRFFRPLSSALLWFDHKVLAHAALPMHLHSFAWWILAALASWSLYAKRLARRPALLATAVFALAPCHALPLAWIANRESLVSLTFGALALSAQARFRDGRRAHDGALALALFSLALLGGGEYALSFGGYVVAMELGRREPVARRFTGWLPFVVPAVLYLVVRGALGYGTAGSGFYSDPLRDPGAFLASAPMRLVTLLATGWLTLEPEWWRVGPTRWVMVGIVLASAALLVRPMRRAFARVTPEARQTATWLLVGSLLAVVPVLAVVPARRLMGASMLGIAPCIALLLDAAWFPTDEEDAEPKSLARAIASLAAIGLGFAHLVHAPGTSWLAARTHMLDGSDFATRVAFLRQKVGDPTRAEIGVVRGLAGDFFAPFALDRRGQTPARWTVLAQAGHVLALRRDEHTLELVAPPGRGIYPMGERNLYRSADAPLRAGAELAAPGFRATVIEASETGPRIVRFVFDGDPDAMKWFTDDFDEMRAATLPKVGFGAPFDPRGNPDNK